MSNPPLPSQLDIRKLTVKGIEIVADAAISSLPRVVDLLADQEGSIAVKLRFYIDEQRFKHIEGDLSSTVNVFCQRCLEPMPVVIDAHFDLGIVWSEDDAERLPKSLDPLIVGEELTDLRDVISEELILSLPYVNYHKPEECGQAIGYSVGDLDEAAAGSGEELEKRENPFKALAKLKLEK